MKPSKCIEIIYHIKHSKKTNKYPSLDVFKPRTMFSEMANALHTQYPELSKYVLNPIDHTTIQSEDWKYLFTEIFFRVDPSNLIEGDPEILRNAFDYLTRCIPRSAKFEILINIISAEIDQSRYHLVHPSFVFILQQLNEDEIVTIRTLKNKPYKLQQRADLNEEKTSFNPRITLFDEFPKQTLRRPEDFLLYFNHLHSLGLAGFYQVGNQETILDHSNTQIGVYINNEWRLTDWGVFFAQTCIS
ncbi:MAG: Abi-alpha family protein [Bacteroidota bacterium]